MNFIKKIIITENLRAKLDLFIACYMAPGTDDGSACKNAIKAIPFDLSSIHPIAEHSCDSVFLLKLVRIAKCLRLFDEGMAYHITAEDNLEETFTADFVGGVKREYIAADFVLGVEKGNVTARGLQDAPIIFGKNALKAMKELSGDANYNPENVLVYNYDTKEDLILKPIKTEKLAFDGTFGSVFKFFSQISDNESVREDFINQSRKLYERVSSMHAEFTAEETISKNYKQTAMSTESITAAENILKRRSKSDLISIIDATFENYDLELSTLKSILDRKKLGKKTFKLNAVDYFSGDDYLMRLDQLKENKIVFCLLKSEENQESWVLLTESNTVIIQNRAPNSKVISECKRGTGSIKLIVKKRGNRTYRIHFSPYVIDSNFYEFAQFYNRFDHFEHKGNIEPVPPHKTEHIKLDSNELISLKQQITENEDALDQMRQDFKKIGTGHENGGILDKLLKLSALYSSEGGPTSVFVSNIISVIVENLRTRVWSSCLSHEYETAKSFCSNLNGAYAREDYIVSINGNCNSITISKGAETLGGFKMGLWFNIYKRSSELSGALCKSDYLNSNGICQSKTYTFNKNTLTYAIKKPFILISLVTWEIENFLKEGDANALTVGHRDSIIFNSVLHSSINTDTFAQFSEQVRYFFVSNTGYGSSPKSLYDKISFFMPKTEWEIAFVYRLITMGISLNVLKTSNELRRIIKDKEIRIIMPSSDYVSPSFDHIVSSMYYCNIYNKKRAFHEISEAICYNSLMNEDDIFKKSLLENKNAVIGILEATMAQFLERKFTEEQFQLEVDNALLLLAGKTKRYTCHIMFIVGASATEFKFTKGALKSLALTRASSPLDACTMKGSMSSEAITINNQSIRAASAIYEELAYMSGASEYIKSENSDFSKERFMNIKEKNIDFSLGAIMNKQVEDDSKVCYNYRIVQKDQKGHREISVLNSKFRMGALLTERVSNALSAHIPEDVLLDPDKNATVEKCLRNSSQKSNRFIVCDNSDQKRWGPNHLLHTFSAMLLPHVCTSSPSTYYLINFALFKATQKSAKFPESLLTLFYKGKIGDSKSRDIREFLMRLRNDLLEGHVKKTFEWGMCQGIFHSTSSLYHALMCRIVARLSKSVLESTVDIESFVTSDDAERIISIDKTLVNDENRGYISICKTIHSIITNVGKLINIIRNESKSVLNLHVCEFNSTFYQNLKMILPTLKERISKIDIGAGKNYWDDLLNAISASGSYTRKGGSYVGARIMTIINLLLVFEQWRMWKFIDNRALNRPVEFLGLPVIEPVSVLLAGPISSFYLRVKKHMNEKEYLIYLQSIKSPEVTENTPSEFTRTTSRCVIPDVTRKFDDLHTGVHKPVGMNGILSMSRTDDELSQFEKRTRSSLWKFSEGDVCLDREGASAVDFTFNLKRSLGMVKFDTSNGVNNEYISFSDPWINATMPCLEISANSYLRSILGQKSSFIAVTKALFDEKDPIRAMKNNTEANITLKPVFSNLAHMLLQSNYIFERISSAKLSFKNSNNLNYNTHINPCPLDREHSVDFANTVFKSVLGTAVKYQLNYCNGSYVTFNQIPVINSLVVDDLSRFDYVYLVARCDSIINFSNKLQESSTRLISVGNHAAFQIYDVGMSNFNFKFTESLSLIKPIKGSFPGEAAKKSHNDYSLGLLEVHKEKQMIKHSQRFAENDSLSILTKVNLISDLPTIVDSDFRLTDERTDSKVIWLNSHNYNSLCKQMLVFGLTNAEIKLHKSDNELMNDNFGILKGEVRLSETHTLMNGSDLFARVEVEIKLIDEKIVWRKIPYVCLTEIKENGMLDVSFRVKFDHSFLNKRIRIVCDEANKLFSNIHFALTMNNTVTFDQKTNDNNKTGRTRAITFTTGPVSVSAKPFILDDDSSYEVISSSNSTTLIARDKLSDYRFPLLRRFAANKSKLKGWLVISQTDCDVALAAYKSFLDSTRVHDSEDATHDRRVLETVHIINLTGGLLSRVDDIKFAKANMDYMLGLRTSGSLDLFKMLILALVQDDVQVNTCEFANYFSNRCTRFIDFSQAIIIPKPNILRAHKREIEQIIEYNLEESSKKIRTANIVDSENEAESGMKSFFEPLISTDEKVHVLNTSDMATFANTSLIKLNSKDIFEIVSETECDELDSDVSVGSQDNGIERVSIERSITTDQVIADVVLEDTDDAISLKLLAKNKAKEDIDTRSSKRAHLMVDKHEVAPLDDDEFLKIASASLSKVKESNSEKPLEFKINTTVDSFLNETVNEKIGVENSIPNTIFSLDKGRLRVRSDYNERELVDRMTTNKEIDELSDVRSKLKIRLGSTSRSGDTTGDAELIVAINNHTGEAAKIANSKSKSSIKREFIRISVLASQNSADLYTIIKTNWDINNLVVPFHTQILANIKLQDN
ncbi:hypothetical protein BB561_004383 [Smittium simulii]|uniref:RdRp catalytic domain-containing protein n=1 Tax=Smittium simulii TaxID=133385 RepID=A0A2T9YGH5_9FUNG|nr:hypothetical protein BB561_004383 [Smittium simulii]